MPYARYSPHLLPNTRTWAILDWHAYGLCTLPDGNGNHLPLEWKSRAAADAWLQQCYLTWAVWEKAGGGTPPEGWRPRPGGPSPYSLGTI